MKKSNLTKMTSFYKRNQESYRLLYGHESSFLEKHRELTLAAGNLQGTEKFLYEYSLGVRDVLGLFEKPYSEKIDRKPSRFQVILDEPYVSFLDLEQHKIEPLPDWEFTYDQLPEFLPFKNQRHISINTHGRADVITSALKLFPDSFLITFDAQLISELRARQLELGVLAKKDNYTCPLGACTFEKATCNKLFGAEKLEHLTINSCYTKCRYLRDVQTCKNVKTAVMRPFTLLTQIFKSHYTPRTLMVIDQGGFEDSLKSYFAFSAPVFKSNYFAELKSFIDSQIFKLKTYEKKGWVTLIEQLRHTSPYDERYPSFKPRKFEYESENTLYLYLKKSGIRCVDGLNSKEFAKYCELKMNIFKMNLALVAKDPYVIRRGVNTTHTPRSTEHIWKSIISKYAKYTLTVIQEAK